MTARLIANIFAAPAYFACALSALLLTAVLASPAGAIDRVALLVGNQHYASFGSLSTPIGDVTAIASELEEAGFKVILATDVDERSFATRLAEFATLADGANIALFYYAGHGLQYKSENYLMPIDAMLTGRFSLTHETVKLDEIQDAASRAHSALIYIDACRSFPDAGTFFANPTERVARVNGPAKVAPPQDVFIGFSASPGQTAQDGTAHSPFATAMLKYLAAPGLSLGDLFGHVAEDVKAQTNGDQLPQGYGTVDPDLRLVAPPPPPLAPPTISAEERAYQAAIGVGTVGALRAYLQTYPSGYYATLARERLEATVGPIGAGDQTDSGNANDPVAQCDTLAGDPTDPRHIGTGTAYERIDASSATAACLAATTARPGEARLMYQYGRSLMASDDSAAALTAFQAAATAGYPEAITSVARAMRDGDAIARDVSGAMELMKKAAEAGSSNAMASLGVFYSKGAQRKDDVAVLWYQRAADLNNPLGLNNLASMYRDGRGVPRNATTAVGFYEKAVGLEYPAAMFNLALLLDSGKGVTRDAPREAALLVGALTLDPDLYDTLISSHDQLSEDLIRAIQTLLQQRGRYIGTLDGKFGKDTRAALAKEVGR